jgi:hypothetical protein
MIFIKRGEGHRIPFPLSSPLAFSLSVNTSTAAAFPDADSAAHKFADQPSRVFRDLIIDLCHHAQRIEALDEYSNSYKLSYLKAAIDLIEDYAKA